MVTEITKGQLLELYVNGQAQELVYAGDRIYAKTNDNGHIVIVWASL